MTLEDEAGLAKRARSGDHDAFKILVRRHWPALIQAARGMNVPATDVDDVVQDAFVAAWGSLEAYDPARSFRAWLFAIALNKMRDHLRFRKVRSFFFRAHDIHAEATPPIADLAANPERDVVARQELQRVQSVLGRLDPKLREALVLTGLVGMSQPEAASALGISLKTIEGRVMRARAQLRALI